MKLRITIGFTARNEECCIGATLVSLLASVAAAEARGFAEYDIVAILDECTDGTENAVRKFPRVTVLPAWGGLIKAQRLIADRRPFVIFCDADILVGEWVIGYLTFALLEDPDLQVAYPLKHPLPPRRHSLMERRCIVITG